MWASKLKMLHVGYTHATYVYDVSRGKAGNRLVGSVVVCLWCYCFYVFYELLLYCLCYVFVASLCLLVILVCITVSYELVLVLVYFP